MKPNELESNALLNTLINEVFFYLFLKQIYDNDDTPEIKQKYKNADAQLDSITSVLGRQLEPYGLTVKVSILFIRLSFNRLNTNNQRPIVRVWISERVTESLNYYRQKDISELRKICWGAIQYETPDGFYQFTRKPEFFKELLKYAEKGQGVL